MKKIIPTDAVLIPSQAIRVFDGVVFSVYQWPQTLYDGSSTTFEMIRRPDTMTAICIVNDKIVVLDEEQPHRGSKISFPGGRAEEDDASTLVAAQREIHEEISLSFRDWKLISVYQPHTKIEWFIYIYLATGPDKKDNPQVDAGEKIEVRELSFDEVKQLSVQEEGYLGESRHIFENLNNLQELLDLPTFQGKEVER